MSYNVVNFEDIGRNSKKRYAGRHRLKKEMKAGRFHGCI